MKSTAIAALCVGLAVSGCATSYSITPMPGDGQTVRYVSGRPTIYAEGAHSAVQVTALDPNEKGRLVYSVAVQNRSEESDNIGVEDVSLTAAGAPVRVFTVPELERMAKNDATTAAVLIALAGGVSAAAAAQSPTSTSTTTTPYGTYRTETTNRALQSLQVAAVSAGTAASLRDVSSGLDATLNDLGANVLQTTTVDPGDSFGGQIIGDRVEIPKGAPLNTELTIRFAGDEYRVSFGIAIQQ
jgi:hypothetical protein